MKDGIIFTAVKLSSFGNSSIERTSKTGYMHENFSTEVLGRVLSVDLSSKLIEPLPGATRLGNLDGLVKTADGYRVNDWMTGELFLLDHQGRRIGSVQSRKGLADIGGGGGVLYLPFMLEGTIEARLVE